MEVLTIYGITSCSSCREARRWLEARDIAYTFHDLREDGLDIQTLERWIDRVDWQKLLNKSSLTWRKLPEVDRNEMTRDRALATMLEHPTLVKRPVLERGKLVAVGFAARQYTEMFK
jgi:Spx/MgsR family transcriptional regulator